jgi:hypothetical protein
MRDKNLNQKQFNIQLERKIHQGNQFDEKFLTRPVFVTPTRPIDPEEVRIYYPRNFRLIRCLCIVFWYFPENLHWRILLDLKDFSFSHFNKKQRIEIQILLSSKENMEKYLFRTERYSGAEIFGNILGNDLQELNKELRFQRLRPGPPRRTIRRRGYKDKGSRRPDHQWLPREDFSLREKQLSLEKDRYLTIKIIKRILEILRE